MWLAAHGPPAACSGIAVCSCTDETHPPTPTHPARNRLPQHENLLQLGVTDPRVVDDDAGLMPYQVPCAKPPSKELARVLDPCTPLKAITDPFGQADAATSPPGRQRLLPPAAPPPLPPQAAASVPDKGDGAGGSGRVSRAVSVPHVRGRRRALMPCLLGPVCHPSCAAARPEC